MKHDRQIALNLVPLLTPGRPSPIGKSPPDSSDVRYSSYTYGADNLTRGEHRTRVGVILERG